MRRRAIPSLLITLLGTLPAGAAESPGCVQARAIVQEVEAMYASGSPDHALVLEKLEVARNLCAALGGAWRYSACSAQALGQERDARRFRDRAILNGVSDVSCAVGGAAPAPAPQTAAPVGPVRAKHALIVGIGKFKDANISPLQFAAKDAKDLAAVLQDPRYGRFDPANVVLLTNEQATRANILKALNEIALKAQEDDLVLLYVSSHGSPRRSDQGLGSVGYIVTHDAALDRLFLDAVEYEDFSRKVALVKARRKVVILDTCYSGQASRPGEKALVIEPAGVDPRTAKLFISGEGTYVITSSKENERSFESDTLQNSYFTYYLIKALQKGAAPPTIKEVYETLAREVPAAVARDKGTAQNPRIIPAGGVGDLRIGVAPLFRGSGETSPSQNQR